MESSSAQHTFLDDRRAARNAPRRSCTWNTERRTPADCPNPGQAVRYNVLNRWKNSVRGLKRNTYALYIAAREPGVPFAAKVIVGVVIAYALSPIDLIPDFIPVLGYLDDLLLLPLGIYLAIKLIPQPVWEKCRQRAEAELEQGLPRNRVAAAVIIAIWLAAIFWISLWLVS